MIGFLMGLIRIFLNFKKKIDKNSLEYSRRRNEVQKKVNRQLNGGKETDEDKEFRQHNMARREKNATRERIKDKLIYGLSFIISIIETLPLLMTALTWSMMIILLCVVVIILFSFMEMLRNLLGLNNDCLPTTKAPETTETSDGSSSSSATGLLSWTEEELQSKGSKLSDHEKNMYRLGILSRQYMTGELGYNASYYKVADSSPFITYGVGLTSIESSMHFFSNERGNIFKDNVIDNLNGFGRNGGYGFMGLEGGVEKMSNYMSSSNESKIRAKYKPSNTPPRQTSFAPYAVAISLGHQKSKYTKVKGVESVVKSKIKDWGFKGEEAEKLKMSIDMFLVQGAYLSWQEKYKDAIDFMLAVYYASSTSDSSRDFNNYSFDYKGYDESTLRYSWTGGRGLLKTSVKKNLAILNGKKLSTDIATHAFKNAPDSKKERMKVVEDSYKWHLSNGAYYTKGQFFYYGMMSMIMGVTVENRLAKKMGITEKSTTQSEDNTKKDKKDTASIKSSSKIIRVANEVDNSDKMKPGGLWVIANKEKENRLPKDFIPKGLVLPDVPRKDDSQTKMTKESAKALENMFSSAKKSGVELGAFSGYRSYATQQSAFQMHVQNQGSEEKAMKISAPPGASEHQTGLTMDIVAKKNVRGSSSTYLVKAFGKTKEGKWLATNAHKYGFILRYPEGKEKITTYEYEPWHFRYVGKELAKKIKDKGLTMEEAKKQGLMGSSDTTATTQKQINKNTKLFYVGDSITESVKPLLKKEFKNITVDSKVGRQMAEAKDILKEQADNKSYGEAVVIALGTNGPFKNTLLKTYIEMFPKDTPIALVNTYHNKKWEKEVNETIKKVSEGYEQVHLIDWNKNAKKEYLTGDGVHLNAKGQKAYTKFVTSELLKIKYGEEEKQEESKTQSSENNSTPEDDCIDEKKEKPDKKEEEKETTTVVKGNFKETPGKGQAVTLKGETTEQRIKKSGRNFDNWVKSFGTSSHLKGEIASMKNYSDPVHGVPFYYQAYGGKSKELYTNNNWSNQTGAYSTGWQSMGVAGCMIFSQAYVLSALTGTLINPSEAFVLLALDGLIVLGGLDTGDMSSMYSRYGIKSKMLYTQFNRSYKGKIISELNKKHPIMFRTKGHVYADPEHYLVLTGYEKVKGKEYLRMYTSAYTNQTSELQSLDAVFNEGHRQGIAFSKK